MDSSMRNNNIDALRLLLAVLVIFSHSYALGLGSEAREPLALATRGQLTLGNLAVDWFFVLSGFLIAQSWERLGAWRPFMLKRIKRIYPGFVVAAALCSWLVVPVASRDYSTYTLAHLVDFLAKVPRLLLPSYRSAFVHNAYPGAVDGSLWSIPYEFWCYVGVALMGGVGLLRHRGWVALLFALAIPIHMVFAITRAHPGGGFLGVVLGYPPLWAMMLPLYLAGVVYYQFRAWLRPRPSAALVAGAGLVVAARIPHAMVVALPTLGTYLLFCLAFSKRIRLYGFAKHGDFSYGVYLYAFPIQQLIVEWAGGSMGPWSLFLCALSPALLVGAASWFLVERRFVRPTGRVRVAAVSGAELLTARSRTSS
jgi:peptidoglycan/LPS O-acetylase OafA/YrhL